MDAVMDRNLHQAKVAAIDFDFGLEEMRARLNAAPQDHFQRGAGKKLKAAGHIRFFRSEQQICQGSAAPADQIALQRCTTEAAAPHEAAAKNAVAAFLHGMEELG